MDRRDFIKSSAAASFAASLNPKFSNASEKPIPHRTLGRTGEKVSAWSASADITSAAPSVEEQGGYRDYAHCAR